MDEVRIAPYSTTPGELRMLIWRRAWRRMATLLVIYGFLVALLVWSLSQNLLGLLVAPVVVLGGMAAFRYSTLPAQIKKLDPLVFADRTLVLTEESCSWTFEAGLQSTVRWTLVRKVEVVEGIYQLSLPGGNAVNIPRRVLTSDQEHFLVERLRAHGLLR